MNIKLQGIFARLACLVLLLGVPGCGLFHKHHAPAPIPMVPSERAKATLPDYTIEPPDVLVIEVPQIVPRGGQQISPLDVVLIQSSESLPDHPISGPFAVATDGTVNLGPVYGTVTIGGLNQASAKEAVEELLGKKLKSPYVTLTVLQSAARQPITGEHLVGPDGTVNLGIYGRVYVAGSTVDLARQQIQAHLSQFLQFPEVAVDVVGYNSKAYFIITEGAGFGDGVNRFPITGNETVLDAISQINGLSQVSSKKIWVSRPSVDGSGRCQILPVDWVAITKCGAGATNYQIFPGDRVFVEQDHLIAFDTRMGKLLAPAERVMGFTLLMTQTIQGINRFPKGYLTPNSTVVVP
jgi:polysaccharide export outer membrane protein